MKTTKSLAARFAASVTTIRSSSTAAHNKPGENYRQAAIRGLEEELGIAGAKVRKIAKMRISSRRETEFDEIFLCNLGKKKIVFDRNEIKEIKFLPPDELGKMVRRKPRSFSSWSVRVFNECREMI